MPTDQALHRLLVRAHIASSEYYRELWFGGCRLEKNVILCPNLKVAECIARLFLPDLRKALSDVEVRTEAGLPIAAHWPAVAPVKVAVTKGREVYTGKAPAAMRDVDLLDE